MKKNILTIIGLLLAVTVWAQTESRSLRGSAEGSLSANSTSTEVAHRADASVAVVYLDFTTLTLADADDEVDFYVQVQYDGTNWVDVENIHFANADNGSTTTRVIVIDDSKDGPGTIQSLTGTNPAAGAEISETVPTNTIWRLKTIRAALVTDATGANRGIHINFTDGTNSYYHTRQHDVQTASLTWNYNYALGTYYDATVLFLEVFNVLPELIMAPGDVWATVTGSIQAADDWGAPQYTVEAWHDPAISTDATMGDNLKSYDRPLGASVRISVTVTGSTAPTYDYTAHVLFR